MIEAAKSRIVPSFIWASILHVVPVPKQELGNQQPHITNDIAK